MLSHSRWKVAVNQDDDEKALCEKSLAMKILSSPQLLRALVLTEVTGVLTIRVVLPQHQSWI